MRIYGLVVFCILHFVFGCLEMENEMEIKAA